MDVNTVERGVTPAFGEDTDWRWKGEVDVDLAVLAVVFALHVHHTPGGMVKDMLAAAGFEEFPPANFYPDLGMQEVVCED